MIYLVCKYSEEDCRSRGERADVIKYKNYWNCCSVCGITLPSLTREVRTTEDASPKFAYLVLRNAGRPNVMLPNILGSIDCDGNADSNRSGWKKVPGTYRSR